MAEKAFVAMTSNEHTGENLIRVKKGKVDSLSVYEITDYELDILLRGSPATIYLNLAIFLLSVATSFLIGLLTTTIESDRTFTVFVVISVLGYISGFILALLWWPSRKEVRGIVKKIKSRIPFEEIEKTGSEPDGALNSDSSADADESP